MSHTEDMAHTSNIKPVPVARKFSKARGLSHRFGICPKTLARWGVAGKISRFKINPRVVLFDEAEVVAFIESTKLPVIRHASATIQS